MIVTIKRLIGFTGLAGLFWLLGHQRANAPTSQVRIKGVPAYYQYPQLPTGCEATSLAMLLSWGLGEEVSKYTVADALSKGDKVHQAGGEWKGANPNKTFVGDPYTDSDDGSYGVFEGPILEAIEMYMPGKGIDLTGEPFDALLDIVRSGKPVLAWTTLEQQETYYGLSWTDEAGDVIDWYENEHAVVLTGVTGDQVIAHDPHTGKAEYYDRKLFERNWQSMGGRAVMLNIGN
ncbi:C39 family peptidase [Lentibacillus salinarum]|uniref:C39 family peptidase n=1 Tax=Lentibacillus salinarum TaxID=446820 RepID=A0ABW3ZZP3_9BACI